MLLRISSFIFIFLFASSCSKNDIEANCQSLKTAMINANIQQAGSAIDAFIKDLPDERNTSQNLNELVRNINGKCGINAEVLCFDCVSTLPSQSEIRLSLQTGNTTINKIIDISYNTDNKMRFQNMHD